MNDTKRRMSCLLLCLFCMISCSGCGLSFFTDLYPEVATISPKEQTVDTTEELIQSENVIYVHVCGCVKNPGLYSFKEGDRIDAAIKAAGGFLKDAKEESVNLAERLIDGSQINVASKEDQDYHKKSAHGSSGQADGGKININLADQAELMTLNGIGQGRALAILAYREEHGEFSSIEDIKNVSGIGEAIYEKIKNTITVE